MFGYVTICEPELKVKDFKAYKACYCGLCKSLKEYYGSLGQLTLTYDMTFVILLLTSLYETELSRCIAAKYIRSKSRPCCRMNFRNMPQI